MSPATPTMYKKTLYALTVWPEWAHAIAYLGKPCENRTWEPGADTVQPGDWLAIHAGAHIGGRPGGVAEREGHEALRRTAEGAGFQSLIQGDGQVLFVDEQRKALYSPDLLVRKSIVALVRFRGVDQGGDGPWDHVDALQWRWTDLVVLPRPVACAGHQGLWPVFGAPLAEVREQLRVELARRRSK